MKSPKPYVIELWDRDTQHVYLATGDEGEILTFEFKYDGAEVAQGICADAFKKYDRDFSYFITQYPHKLAEPLK